MRYDDPARPVSDLGATATPLQSNGSPLPSISLIRPMQSERDITLLDTGTGEARTVREWTWGWLCCVHAHKSQNRFGTFYAWIGDLGQFQRDYLDDPEAALLRYFKYDGPKWEPTERSPVANVSVEEDIFATGEGGGTVGPC